MKDSSSSTRRDNRTTSSPVSDEETDEEPPKPVSSGDEDDNNEDDDDTRFDDDHSNAFPSSAPQNTTPQQQQLPPTSSRLFAPYRSVGIIITQQCRFHLVPHQNSATAIVACPIGDRFQLMQTNKLHPVLVSHSVPHNGTIQHIVTDPTLSITLAAYGTRTSTCCHSVALFQRNRVLQTQRLTTTTTTQQLSIVDLHSLGHIRQSVENGKNETENAAVIAVLLRQAEDENDVDAAVPTVGDDDNDDNDDDSRDDMSVDGEEDVDAASSNTNTVGQLVILVAMRRGMVVRSRMDLAASSIRPRVCVHPSTYVNKLLIGGDGGACLVNVRSSKLIHTFQCLDAKHSSASSSDKAATSITTMEQAPAVDTIAMGTKDGKVHLVNIRVDQLLFTLTHKQTTPITSLSFRTDASALHYGISPLAVGCGDGTVFVWDLNRNEAGSRTVLCEMQASSTSTSCHLQFFPQEPLLLVAGHNSLHMYVFDQPDHQPRLLRHRSGHTQPPSVIQYTQHQSRVATSMDGTDAAACQIISTGGHDRTVRLFSTARSVLDTELSQGKGLERKVKQWKLSLDRTELLLPPTTAIAVADSVRDWGNMLTIHAHHAFAYVWSTATKSQSGPVLRQDEWKVGARHRGPPRSAHATSVALSACGNFALVGTLGGTIYKYNIESGLARGSYPAADDSAKTQRNRRLIGSVHRTATEIEKKLKVLPTNRAANIDRHLLDQQERDQRHKKLQAKLRLACHEGYAVTGLAVDTMNRVLISVGADGKLILWHLHSHAPHSKSPFVLPCGATQLVHVRESDLAAVALENHSVLLFDCAALAVVRRFGGTNCHQQAISDMAFSQDGRMLFTSSLDSTIRVWDVPTNACVDWLAFASPPTSIAVSPTGEFLATTHADQLGLSIWSDKSYYQTLHLGTTALESPIQMHKPIPVSDDGLEQNQGISKTSLQSNDDSDHDPSKAPKKPVVPKEPGLVTLSGQPVTHWKNLFHLDLIKARNRPKEPPKRPPTAPFFLQYRGSDLPAVTGKEEKQHTGVDDEWEAAWSDDEGDNDNTVSSGLDGLPPLAKDKEAIPESKRRKRVALVRSNLSKLLSDATATSKSKSSSARSSSSAFREVTDYIASLGPSAIDIELTSLCHGAHDLEDGLPLLLAACSWLTEACQSHERFEAVNAYVNRYLHLHAATIASLDFDRSSRGEDEVMEDSELNDTELQARRELLESLGELRIAQASAANQVKEKLEHTLCLLRHFSRIV